MRKSFWDLDDNGRLDAGEIFRMIFMVLCYTGGPILMLSTAMRSYHLLSSPQMRPGDLWWWAALTALTPELGLLTAWLATETGFRKGKLELAITGIAGIAMFAIVIGTMNIYDVSLINGEDISIPATWGHFIASILPLITIGYLILCNALGAAMARREKLKHEPSEWRVQQPRTQLSVVRPSAPEQEEYGEPLTDPLSQSVGGRRVRPNPKGNPHQAATKTALEALNSIRSVGSNGKSEKPTEMDFT